MNISLSPELAAKFRRRMESGPYQSEEELLDEALGVLDRRDQRLAELREKLALAERQADAGLAVSIDMDSFLKEIKQRRSAVDAHVE